MIRSRSTRPVSTGAAPSPRSRWSMIEPERRARPPCRAPCVVEADEGSAQLPAKRRARRRQELAWPSRLLSGKRKTPAIRRAQAGVSGDSTTPCPLIGVDQRRVPRGRARENPHMLREAPPFASGRQARRRGCGLAGDRRAGAAGRLEKVLRPRRLGPVRRVRRHRLGLAAVDLAPEPAQQPEAIGPGTPATRLVRDRAFRSRPAPAQTTSASSRASGVLQA